jgi:hypothetical protein
MPSKLNSDEHYRLTTLVHSTEDTSPISAHMSAAATAQHLPEDPPDDDFDNVALKGIDLSMSFSALSLTNCDL